MSEIRYIALDLDGTLTNEEKIITPKTMAALMRAQENGVRLILASGRPPYGMRPLSKQLKMEQYGGLLLCYNGGHIEDSKSGAVLHDQVLDDSCLEELLALQAETGLTLMTYFEDSIYTENPDDQYVAISSRNNNMRITPVTSFIHEVPRPLNKCLMVGAPEVVVRQEPRLREIFRDRLFICHSTPYFIEVLPMGIDKGPSLSRLMETLGDTTDSLMAFGDSYNDITMLKAAGIGVAMANAEDAVKAVADFVTLSNEEDGVAYALEKFGVPKLQKC